MTFLGYPFLLTVPIYDNQVESKSSKRDSGSCSNVLAQIVGTSFSFYLFIYLFTCHVFLATRDFFCASVLGSRFYSLIR